MTDFGTLLFKLRKEKGWTQTELADKLNVTNQAVSKWETGDSYPETSQLLKLSELFDISIDDLLKGHYPQNKENKEITNINSSPISKKPKKWMNTFAVLISSGILLIFIGIIIYLIGCILYENTELELVIFIIALFASIAVGVPILTFAGITDSYYYIETNDNDCHRQKTRQFSISISFGVMLCILSIIAFITISFFENNKTGQLISLASGFTIIAIAVILFIFSGIKWSNYTNELKAQGIHIEPKENKKGLSKYDGVVMLTCTAIYLVLGFIFRLWHPGWVIFPIGGIICAIFNAIDERKNS